MSPLQLNCAVFATQANFSRLSQVPHGVLVRKKVRSDAKCAQCALVYSAVYSAVLKI